MLAVDLRKARPGSGKNSFKLFMVRTAFAKQCEALLTAYGVLFMNNHVHDLFESLLNRFSGVTPVLPEMSVSLSARVVSSVDVMVLKREEGRRGACNDVKGAEKGSSVEEEKVASRLLKMDS